MAEIKHETQDAPSVSSKVEGLVDRLIAAVRECTLREALRTRGGFGAAADVANRRSALLAAINPTLSGSTVTEGDVPVSPPPHTEIQVAREAETAELIAAVTDLLDSDLEHPIGNEYATHPDEWDKRPGDSLGKDLYRGRWMLRDRVRKALRALQSPSRQEEGSRTEGRRPDEQGLSSLEEEVAYWRRDLEARLWSLTARYQALKAEGRKEETAALGFELRSALASYDDAKGAEWHQRCDVCGEFVLPGEPRAGDGEISGHARCLVDDQQDAAAEPEPADNLDARAAAARAALNEPLPAEEAPRG